jgi:hypothetical protein
MPPGNIFASLVARCHAAEERLRLGSYRDVVFNLSDSRRRPRGALRLLFFGPGANTAIEPDRAARNFNTDASGV